MVAVPALEALVLMVTDPVAVPVTVGSNAILSVAD
jgi:hypothetical protein